MYADDVQPYIDCNIGLIDQYITVLNDEYI